MIPKVHKRVLVGLTSAMALGGLTHCSNSAQDVSEDAVEVTEARASLASAAGQRHFTQPFPHTNGRSCATCHPLGEHTTLLPASVEARLAADPKDPLFHRIDADDPDAAVPTYEHLKKGLVRILLPLPGNMDVIDTEGNVITPPDRKVSVWRGVPSVQDTAFSGPFLYDGRAATLQEQAQAAILSHSEGGEVSGARLNQIAEFERSLFTSPRARFVSALLEAGVPLANIPVPEDFMALSAQEQRGREVYKAACAGCHGGATTGDVVDPAVRDTVFRVALALKPDGNVVQTVVPGQGPLPVLVPHPDPNNRFLNLAFGFFSYLGQLGQFPTFNASVELPRYRFRFYTDATRQQVVTELPPIPVTASGDPLDPNPAVDEDGTLIVGPNFGPQWFTTDPGRALITGNPADFEAFDVPQLRGVARTPPYFHDNSHETLQDVVDTYSRFILPFVPVLELPPVHPPEFAGGLPESLSPSEKQDLLMFLNRL